MKGSSIIEKSVAQQLFPDEPTTDSTIPQDSWQKPSSAIVQQIVKTLKQILRTPNIFKISNHCATNGKSSETNIENTNQLI